MKIYKFGKIPTGSVQGMKGMLRLIDNSIPQIIVLSATTETTERLAGIAAHLFNRDTEQAHDEISRLEFRFIDFANAGPCKDKITFLLDFIKNPDHRYTFQTKRKFPVRHLAVLRR